MNVAEKEKIFEELDIVLLTQPFETSHPNTSGDWKITSPTSNYTNKGKPFVILYLIIM